MKRNLTALTENNYDLLIIGGGIYGACIAWDASLRGLSVALVEKADFGGATSANSLKIIHGGLRYLQKADFKRMRESIKERTTLMGIAPHLIHPLPVLVPTYGHGLKGREALTMGLLINDIISSDRNQLNDPQKHIPNGRIISQAECQELLPNIPKTGLTGGAIFCDAQVYNSERLTLSFLKSAEQQGATLANYVEVTGFLFTENRITGVKVKDELTASELEIRAKTVVNTSGPWLNQILNFPPRKSPLPPLNLAKAMNLITRPLFDTYAVGLSGAKRQLANGSVQKSRFFFIAPWRGKSMIGTWYSVYNQDPNQFKITEAEIQEFIGEINLVYPAAKLQREDISFVHGGLLPRIGIDAKTGEPKLADQYQLRDHTQDGCPGLISVLGVKYTTARDVAEKAVDFVFKTWDQYPPESKSAITPIDGGKIESFNDFLHQAILEGKNQGLTESQIHRLVYNYGSSYPNVLNYLKDSPDSQGILNETELIKAEVLHAIHEEMAQKLSDVVFRRTELGSAGDISQETLNICAKTMGEALGWSQTQIEEELKDINLSNGIQSLAKI